MELFHEYHNRFFMALVELAERIASGETISAAEFERIYFELGSNGRKRIGDTFLENIKHNTKLPLFDFSDRNAVKLAFDVNSEQDIANIPLKVERIWCEAALCDNYAALFYDENTVQELRSSIGDRSIQYCGLIDSSVCDMTPDELYAVQTVFRNVLDAILACENVQFCYGRDTISGTPLRIIYDEKEKAFSILLKCGDEANTYDMSKITDFRITGGAAKAAFSVKALMSPYKASEPIVFEVTDHKDRRAIERAVITFSVYDHIVRLIDEKKAEITINYYQFDLDDIVRRILSFGTDAVILSPNSAKEHLKKILKSV